ncbi:Regulator of rDNA transcription 14 [Yarrowia sp. E02]|nr:Regulator of rDNA transcription 14 [Yarrowia sp. E02]
MGVSSASEATVAKLLSRTLAPSEDVSRRVHKKKSATQRKLRQKEQKQKEELKLLLDKELADKKRKAEIKKNARLVRSHDVKESEYAMDEAQLQAQILNHVNSKRGSHLLKSKQLAELTGRLPKPKVKHKTYPNYVEPEEEETESEGEDEFERYKGQPGLTPGLAPVDYESSDEEEDAE